MAIPAGAVIGHTLAGVVHHNTGESERAVAAFGRVLELDPELEQMPLRPRSMFWAEFGLNLILIGRPDEAQRHLHRALREAACSLYHRELLARSAPEPHLFLRPPRDGAGNPVAFAVR